MNIPLVNAIGFKALLITALVGALGTVIGSATAGWYFYGQGQEDKLNELTADWNKQRAADMQAMVDEKEDQWIDAQKIADGYASQTHQLEVAYADARTKLRSALQRPISCPTGGLPLGDVVVPGAALLELRAVSGFDRVPEAEPAASGTGR